MEDKKISFIDLFAGIGGIRIAFEKNGCCCKFSSEWDVHSQKTYQLNFGEVPVGDITKIKPKDIPDHDILTGGFPCQPFSTIGKREGFAHPTQGTLFYDIRNILAEKRPKAFLLENVAGLYSHDGGKTFSEIKRTLHQELEYWVDDRLLDSADFEVPQHRKRVYIVGFRKDISEKDDFSFNWPDKSPNRVGIGQFVEKGVSGYTISKHLQNSYMYKKDDGRPQVIDETSDIQVKTLVSTYHKIQRLTGTFVKDGETGLRLLSENECKAIMGFPKEFHFPVSRTQMYRQLGNSVAIPVVKKIAEQIVESLKHDSIVKTEGELADKHKVNSF